MGNWSLVVKKLSANENKETRLIPRPPFIPNTRVSGPQWLDGRTLLVHGTTEPGHGFHTVDVESYKSDLLEPVDPRLRVPVFTVTSDAIWYPCTQEHGYYRYDRVSRETDLVHLGVSVGQYSPFDVSPDGEWLAFATGDPEHPGANAVFVSPTHGPDAGTPTKLWGDPERVVTALAWTREGLVVGTDSGEIFTLDPKTGDRHDVLEVDGIPGGFDVFVDDDGERRLSYHTETGGMHLIAVSGFLDD